MNASKGFKLFAALLMVISITAYSAKAVPIEGGIVFLMAVVTFLLGYFAGEDC